MIAARRRACGTLLVLSLAAVWLPSGARAAPQSVDDFFQSRQTRFRVTLRLDRVGLVFPVSSDSLNITAVADSLRLVVLNRYPEGLVELSLGRPLTRDSLLHFVRSIRRSFAPRVMNSGLVVYRPGAVRPMILTDQVIVRLRPGADSTEVDSLSGRLGARIVDRSRYFPGQRLVELADLSSPDAIAASRSYAALGSLDYAVPNVEQVVWSEQSPWDEKMYPRQWHLENDGSNGGTEDADIDARKAWDFTQGSPSTVVAVIDRGFDIHHEDLVDNLWVNDDPCNGIDDDGNGFVDDVHGVDFFGEVEGCGTGYGTDHCVDCSFKPGDDCSSSHPNARGYDLDLSCNILDCDDMHGTLVAGLIAASGTNGKGGTGVAPGARLMLIRRTSDPYYIAQSFGYAMNEGASVINCSWQLDAGTILTAPLGDAIQNAATLGRGGKGCVITYAMSNSFNDDSAPGNSVSNSDVFGIERPSDHEPALIPVSGTNNRDGKVHDSGYGAKVSVLAPDTGTLKIATTDWTGPVGYNDSPPPCKADCPDAGSLPRESADQSYTYCFSGTSASTAIVSGVAALVLSADPDLTQPQVRHLLQDTADKVENGSGAEPAEYNPETGFSEGTVGHGWGRANAFEAVRIAAAASAGGKGGVDVFARDQDLDWGNTEQPSNTLFEPTRGLVPHWESVDVKVDAGPSWQPIPATSADFQALTDEVPTPGALNRVYVRVRNRGFRTAPSVLVKLHWAYAGTALPQLPADFWAQFPSNSSDVSQWHPIGTATLTNLEYSGCSATRPPEVDRAQVAEIDFTAPPISAEPTHYCLLAILDADADRPGPKTRPPVDADRIVDLLTVNDNNVAQKNVVVMPSLDSTFRFYVRNPGTVPQEWRVRLAKQPKAWRCKLNPPGPYSLKPGDQVLVTATILRPRPTSAGTVVLVQENDASLQAGQLVGGITLRFGQHKAHKPRHRIRPPAPR